MYRVLTTGLGLVIASTVGHANAPSITTLGGVADDATPSIVYRGHPAVVPPETVADVLSSEPALSVVDSDTIAPASEAVAAEIDTPPTSEPTPPIWMSQALPMIIRGGETVSPGDAFTSPPRLDSQTD